MDTRDLKGLMEAYSEVYAPQEEVVEAVKGADPEMRKAASAERRGGDKPLPAKEGEKYSKFKASQISYIDKKTKGKHIPGYAYAEEVEQIDEISQKTAIGAYAARATGEYEYDTNPSDQTKSGKYKSDVARGRIEKKFGKKAAQHADRAAHAQIFGRRGMPSVKEELDIFDVVLEFLQVEGYAETLEEAQWIMANQLDVEDIEAILEAEGSYGQTPKAHAAFASLAAKRQQKPASQYPQRGAKTKAVASAEKHTERSKPTPAHRGRGPMDDESREYSREKSEVYGGGRVSDKGGSITKNPKKLRKQKAIGEHD